LQAPRLVATDLDGTIVRHDGTVSPRTLGALARAEAAGAQVVLVTGRPPWLMDRIAEVFGHHGVVICSNGAFVYDLGTGDVVRERPIPVDVLAQTVGRLRETLPELGLAIEFAHDVTADAAYERDEWDEGSPLVRVEDDVFLSRSAPKLVGRHPTLSADELVALLDPVVGDLVHVYHANGTRLVEAIASGVSKASALADVAAEHGIDAADSVAFGDMPNDLPMLAWAGTSYAVAGAHPDVLAAADHVIGDVEDDGVAEVVERLFPTPDAQG
jgi:Cof subfamily protein (haloacid dehalogenase superfamily)